MDKKPVLDDQALMEVYRLRLEMDPGSKLFLPLAILYRKHGETDRAIDLCLQGLERYPHYQSARVNLAMAYLDRGDVEEAANQILRVLETHPDNLLAREILAETYYQRGQIESALREYHTLRQQAPLGRKYDSKIQELREVAGSCGVDDLPELNPEDIDLEELIETETPISEIPAVLPTPELEATTEEILPVPAQEFSEPGSSMLTSEAAVVPEAAILSTLEKWLENIHRLYPHLGPVS